MTDVNRDIARPDNRSSPQSAAVRLNLRLAAAVCAVGLFGLAVLLLKDESPIETRRLKNRDLRPDQAIGGAAVGIDPNTASWAELALLPGLGESVARRIIDYRDDRKSRNVWPAFQRPEDLLPVKGIGEKTLNRMRHLLRFGGPAASD